MNIIIPELAELTKYALEMFQLDHCCPCQIANVRHHGIPKIHRMKVTVTSVPPTGPSTHVT